MTSKSSTTTTPKSTKTSTPSRSTTKLQASPPPVKPIPDIQSENRAPSKFLYRDSDHAIIGGVCAGLAAYFSVNPLILRILFLLFLFFGGFGVILYLIMWAIIPVKSNLNLDDPQQANDRGIWTQITAFALIVIGFFWLLNNLGLNPLGWIHWSQTWPLILIIIGIYLLRSKHK